VRTVAWSPSTYSRRSSRSRHCYARFSPMYACSSKVGEEAGEFPRASAGVRGLPVPSQARCRLLEAKMSLATLGGCRATLIALKIRALEAS